MPEKISITRKEIEELYDITDDVKESVDKGEQQEKPANATFEEYTEYYDKNQIEVEKEDG